MPLRNLIKNSPETLSDFLLAADDRYAEAENLILHQQYDGAVYLLGYAAEIWLKTSCLRLRGHGAAAQAKSAIVPLKSWMQLNAPSVAFSDYHDLAFWGYCIIELRRYLARPLPEVLFTELQSHVVNGLYPEWIVDMRCRRAALTAADAWAALENSWWIKTNWTNLI